jgi:hypothetical protein
MSDDDKQELTEARAILEEIVTDPWVMMDIEGRSLTLVERLRAWTAKYHPTIKAR